MTTVWWVRHGPTHVKTCLGWRDLPADLSDRDHLSRIDGYLPKDALVVASDLIRASDTATAIAGGRQRLPDDPNLREIDFGVWDGMTFDQIAARDPVLSRQFWEQPGDLCAPDGESWNSVTDRVSGVIDDIIASHSPSHVIAVAHIGVIMCQIARVSGMTPYRAMGHLIAPLSVTELRLDSGTWQAGIINHEL